MRVYDTALPQNAGHAEAMADNKGATRKVKSMLRQQMCIRLMYMAQSAGIHRSPFIDNYDADLMALGVTIHGPSQTAVQ